jgi:HSP20 family protein
MSTGLIHRRPGRDPFGLLREMTSDFDRIFDDPFWPSVQWPRRFSAFRTTGWAPEIDVFEKDNRLFTRVDLPGMTKDDVKIEVTDGYLTISGERKSEAEEKKDNYFRCEREYGSFYRAVPLPEGVKFEDITATFTDGVLEVGVPLPAKAEAKPRRIEIHEPPKAVKAAA